MPSSNFLVCSLHTGVSSDGTTLNRRALAGVLASSTHFQAAGDAGEVRGLVAGLELRADQGERIALERDCVWRAFP